jgi:hypothetical protein
MAYDLGSDIGCTTGVDWSLTTVSGRKALAQAVVRRWITEPGDLVYDEDYGFGLLTYLSGAMQATGVIAAGLRAEALKDERVEDCQVEVSFDRASALLSVSGKLTDAEGPFDLTLSLSTTTLTIQQLAVS